MSQKQTMTPEQLSELVCEASIDSSNFDPEVYERSNLCCVKYHGPLNYHDWCDFCKGAIGIQAFVKGDAT